MTVSGTHKDMTTVPRDSVQTARASTTPEDPVALSSGGQWLLAGGYDAMTVEPGTYELSLIHI